MTNIILIMADQFRGDALGADGNSWIQTPHLDWMAARGRASAMRITACPRAFRPGQFCGAA